MTKLEEIKKDAAAAENLIKAIIQDFIDNHGLCDIQISNQLHFIENGLGEKKLIGNRVNFKVII